MAMLKVCISCAPLAKRTCFQFDNVLVMLSTYFFDERMFADWGQWNREFQVNAVVGIAAMFAVSYRIGVLCKSLSGVYNRWLLSYFIMPRR